MASASGEPGREDASDVHVSDSDTAAGSEVSLIHVTRPVSAELREMRTTDPKKARAVDHAIRLIPTGAGHPIRITVPSAPAGRAYRAIEPADVDAPAVIYRDLEPSDGVEGRWLVTTLIERDKFQEYMRAERRGLLDEPAVRDLATSVAGTVSSIVVSAPPGQVDDGRR